MTRGRTEDVHPAHNRKVAGSSPASATAKHVKHIPPKELTSPDVEVRAKAIYDLILERRPELLPVYDHSSLDYVKGTREVCVWLNKWRDYNASIVVSSQGGQTVGMTYWKHGKDWWARAVYKAMVSSLETMLWDEADLNIFIGAAGRITFKSHLWTTEGINND